MRECSLSGTQQMPSDSWSCGVNKDAGVQGSVTMVCIQKSRFIGKTVWKVFNDQLEQVEEVVSCSRWLV